MNKLSHKISSLLLALLVLFSTSSYTVESHYCGGSLVDSSFFGHVKSCGVEMLISTVTTDDCSEASKNCCRDEKVFIDGQDELITSSVELTFQQQLFIASFVDTYINLFKGIDDKVIPFKNYSSPVLVKDIQLLDEVFII